MEGILLILRRMLSVSFGARKRTNLHSDVFGADAPHTESQDYSRQTHLSRHGVIEAKLSTQWPFSDITADLKWHDDTSFLICTLRPRGHTATVILSMNFSR